MTTDLSRVSAAWRAQSETYIQQLTDDILAHAGPSYTAIPRAQMVVAAHQVVAAWQAAFDTNDSMPIREFARQIGQRRSESHVVMDDIMRVVSIIREGIWRVLAGVDADGSQDITAVEQIEGWLHEMRNAVVSSYGATLQEAEQQLVEREQALAHQRLLIQELSTPIVPIHEGVLVLPLVGGIDTRRATQIMEAVLEHIVASQADVLILDITGVPVVDTTVGNYILQMARAVTLLGATIILVGIGSSMAMTLVELGVDLNSIVIKANLRDGIAYALEQLGLSIQPLRP